MLNCEKKLQQYGYFVIFLNKILEGDCLQVMKDIPDSSIDMILCDLPYGMTNAPWDSVIPLEILWNEYWRISKPSAAIVLTASQPFTSTLVTSQPKNFRCEWIWIKNRGSNFLSANKFPLKEHESVLMFSKGKWTFNKQMQERAEGGKNNIGRVEIKKKRSILYKDCAEYTYICKELRVPSSHQKFNCEIGLHPTQKPVDLFRYMIRTYSNPGETILDNCIGSGTTAIAALMEDRKFIGIEKDAGYISIAQKRIEDYCKNKEHMLF